MILKKVYCVGLLLLSSHLLLTTPVKADDPTGGFLSDTPVVCQGVPEAEATVVKCNLVAYEKADRELNTIYQQLIAKADPQGKEYLIKIQLAWIKLKESQCGLVNYYYKDARFPEKWKTQCEAVMTIRRVNELKALGTGISW